MNSSHHFCGGAVLIPLVQVTLPIMWLDETPQPAVQSEVRDVVCGEHQQVVGLLSPTDLRLSTENFKASDRQHLDMDTHTEGVWNNSLRLYHEVCQQETTGGPN